MNKALCQAGLKSFRNLDELRSELGRLCSTVKLNLDKVETLEDSTYSILFYNYAVYLYANKQYSKCFKIVDKLYYQFNELLEAALLRHISLIFVELLVQKRQVSRKYVQLRIKISQPNKNIACFRIKAYATNNLNRLKTKAG